MPGCKWLMDRILHFLVGERLANLASKQRFYSDKCRFIGGNYHKTALNKIWQLS